MRILWTKVYKLNHYLGAFRIYISQHSNGTFFGAVNYYNRAGEWSRDETVSLNFKLEQFIDINEEKAYQACLDWVRKNLKGNFSVELLEYMEFDK